MTDATPTPIRSLAAMVATLALLFGAVVPSLIWMQGADAALLSAEEAAAFDPKSNTVKTNNGKGKGSIKLQADKAKQESNNGSDKGSKATTETSPSTDDGGDDSGDAADANLGGTEPDTLAFVETEETVAPAGGEADDPDLTATPVTTAAISDPVWEPESSTTAAPTTAPTTSPTTAPTTAPSTTVAPTTAPSTTEPSTPEPSTTVAPTTAPSTTVPSTTVAGPTLVFEDNFDSLNTSRWRPEFSTYGDGNNELQCYRPDQVSVEDGSLTLRARYYQSECVSGDVRDVTSGMVRSSGFTFTPGQRIEFRARMNIADTTDMGGLWPAFWASSWNGGGWPRGGELDVLEWISKDPNRTHHSIHWLNDSYRHQHWSDKSGVTMANTWHTFAFDWTTTELRWYVDGELAASIDPRTLNTADGINPFTNPDATITQIKINLALGGSWGGPLGSTALDTTGSTSYQVDYVRIYDL